MTIEDKLLENGCEDAAFFIGAPFDDAVIGVSESGAVIYDFDLIVEGFMKYDGMSAEEASEWVEYNVIQALPHMGEQAPIIMYRLLE